MRCKTLMDGDKRGCTTHLRLRSVSFCSEGSNSFPSEIPTISVKFAFESSSSSDLRGGRIQPLKQHHRHIPRAKHLWYPKQKSSGDGSQLSARAAVVLHGKNALSRLHASCATIYSAPWHSRGVVALSLPLSSSSSLLLDPPLSLIFDVFFLLDANPASPIILLLDDAAHHHSISLPRKR